MIQQILHHIANTYTANPDQLTFTSHHNIGADACITVICYNRQKPICIGRISRWDPNQVQQEYNTLKSVREMVNEQYLEETIEKPLGIHEITGTPVLFKEAVVGQTGRDMILSGNKKADLVLTKSVDWITRFHTNTRKLSSNDRQLKEDKLLKLGASENELYTTTFINNDEFSLGPVHGDFTTPNIIFSKESELSGVIDFEDYTKSGVRIQDFMLLIISLGINKYGLQSQRVMDNLFSEGGELTRSVRKSMVYYCKEMDISPEAFVQVLPLHSDLEVTRLQRRGQHGQEVDFHTELRSKLKTLDKGFIR